MAGHSVGTIFVELDLDSSRYVGAQKRLLKDATATTLNIESNFKKMGIKSSAEFDLLRQRAVNAFERIKNSSQVTSNDIVRAEKAKADTIKRLNEQQYGSHESMLSKMKENWLALTGAVVAAYYTIRKVANVAMDLALTAARYETLGVAMEVVGRNAGYSAYHMAAFQKGLESTGISMAGARQALVRMAQAQLDLAQSSKLARVAQDAAVIGAMNSTEAFNNMVYGIQTANVRVLRTIGINVSWEESYQKMAKQLGRTANSFTLAEKAEIRLNAVLEAGERIAGTYEAAMDTAGKKLLSLERYVDNFKVTVGEGFLPVLGELVDETTEWFKANGRVLGQDIAGWLKGTIEMLKLGIKPLQMWAEVFQYIGWMAGGGKGQLPKYMPKAPAGMPSGQIGYPDMSSLIGKPGGGAGGAGGDAMDASTTTALEKATMEFEAAKANRTEMEIFMESSRIQTLQDMDTAHRQWEMDTLTASTEYKQTALQAEHNAALTMIKARNDAEIALENQKLKWTKDNYKKTLDTTQYTFNTLMNMSQGHSREIFEVMKAAATANAIVSTYAAAARAMAEVPYPFNFVAAASVIAFGLAQVQQIQSQSFDSGATGGASGGAVSTISTPTLTSPHEPEPEAEQNRGTLTINIQGDFIGDEGYIDMLVDKINAADDRDVFINQSLQARSVG